MYKYAPDNTIEIILSRSLSLLELFLAGVDLRLRAQYTFLGQCKGFWLVGCVEA